MSVPGPRPSLFGTRLLVRLASVQVIATLSMLAVAALAVALAGRPLPLPVLGLVQAVLAWTLSRAFGLPPWWQAIMACSLPAILAAGSLDPPGWIWPVGFGALVLVFWRSFSGQVPLFLSGPRALTVLARLLPHTPGARVLDMGAGAGGVIASLHGRRPDLAYSGLEWAPVPWLLGWLRWRLSGRRVDWRRQDYWIEDLAPYALVYAYLSPAAMPGLARKAWSEMRPGSVLVSYRFAIEGVPADEIIPVGSGEGDCFHVWRFPGADAN